jgi:isopentenyl-diphosphate delta-isomerase
LDLCATGDVEPEAAATLLDCVQLVHCAMPELAVSDVSLEARMFGKALRAPLVITGMTGGTERARQVNRDLASLAEEYGLAFGVGSQRAMVDNPESALTYQVRDVAPAALVIGNIGLRQGIALGSDGVQRLVEAIRADGLALHLNVGQELTQPEGDRDFRGGYAFVEKLVRTFGERLLVKETGCGISPEVARRLASLGVTALDVSGSGGTSWVRVEELRAQGLAAEVGKTYAAWGVPTAAAVATVRNAVGPKVTLVASGGIRTGLDIAKALALGADLAGMALPLFRAQQAGGREGARFALEAVLLGLRHALVLTGTASACGLRDRPKIVTGLLRDWMAAL